MRRDIISNTWRTIYKQFSSPSVIWPEGSSPAYSRWSCLFKRPTSKFDQNPWSSTIAWRQPFNGFRFTKSMLVLLGCHFQLESLISVCFEATYCWEDRISKIGSPFTFSIQIIIFIFFFCFLLLIFVTLVLIMSQNKLYTQCSSLVLFNVVFLAIVIHNINNFFLNIVWY